MAKKITKEEIKREFIETNENRGIILDTKRVAAYCRVSTDFDEQKESYENQKAHFEQLIAENPNWQLVKIYSDQGISGTSTEKRMGFNEMISDAMHGKIDIILVKNLSRFSRRTIDTLNYINELSKNGVSVIFEEDHIDTSVMVNQMVLTFLSAICQQEVLNTSEHAKQGIAYKMQQDKMVGGHRCLGYECNYKENTMTIIPEEAKIVKYIYDRYLSGIGCYIIAKELTQKGIKTMRGNEVWNENVIRDIIRNEVYTGDLLQGKTVTLDVLNHRRVENRGEGDKYIVSNHHEPIISREDFDTAQAIRKSRSHAVSPNMVDSGRRRNSKMFTLSAITFCGFCGGPYSHRILHANQPGQKEVWDCMTRYKKGKTNCPDSKAIDQVAIEKAFVEAFNIFAGDTDALQSFLTTVEKTLSTTETEKKYKELDKKLKQLQNNNDKLLDLYLNSSVDKELLDKRVGDNNKEIEKCKSSIAELKDHLGDVKSKTERILEFKKAFDKCSRMKEFDSEIFLAVIDKVIIGGYDEDGNKDPYKITFVFKSGNEIEENGELFKPARKKRNNVSKPTERHMLKRLSV